MSTPLLVIIGAGPGVSAGVARRFGKEGFRIVLAARRAEALEIYTKELTELGIEAYPITADAADPASLIAAFETIKQKYGAPDVLVYNAAVISMVKPTDLTESQLLDEFKVNVVGALTSAKQVIPDMLTRKQGTLLFTGGGLALAPSAAVSSLSIGKAGIRSLAFTLAEELRPHGIYVGTVTIAGYVAKDSYYDPDAIAEQYWLLHTNGNETEFLYSQV
ncbi:short-chain dehydrogenase [Paenibacillus sp. FSL H8-0548]|uniref:SDR family NAD(P)-dependent oxidoreductase n=1 Tax=Paenibacillus sp. FSL H8-0548 TaxID=1920422 RepID=UPI00096DB546|nr:SDR family NAD(P)-dependent oxidoreductase [Paenibacillus sp. FSL H8-0548]OMF27180.1 short-chain dehydrogenase [Paenibacillus sp. FSL H8-0548]